ncbi:hypothetical protein B0H10DRAFT_1940604 [Mycena sp. CBHHK59/15]|nr:hypothetical protein B0H10DRAFT_1940604 [Mycena sp. CBHHK59/15]
MLPQWTLGGPAGSLVSADGTRVDKEGVQSEDGAQPVRDAQQIEHVEAAGSDHSVWRAEWHAYCSYRRDEDPLDNVLRQSIQATLTTPCRMWQIAYALARGQHFLCQESLQMMDIICRSLSASQANCVSMGGRAAHGWGSGGDVHQRAVAACGWCRINAAYPWGMGGGLASIMESIAIVGVI